MFARDVLWFYSLGRENDVLRDEGEAHGRKLAAARRSGQVGPLRWHDPRLHAARSDREHVSWCS
jgi:hypothetical protein